FDTLGESNVLFIAACSVLILLRVSGSKDGKPSTEQLEAEADDRMYEPKNDAILQHAANFLVPLILMFGVYVILNGHISPGGGFSGGAIMGAGLILYLNAFGFKRTERFFTFTTFKIVSCVALSFYALSKAYSFFTGANHLPSIITTGTPGMIFSAGLIPYLNIAVGLVVCCTMYAFYTLFRKGDM
ncbi:MAG: MnhB domain-containing protein, partial [Christensenellales bacterium]